MCGTGPHVGERSITLLKLCNLPRRRSAGPPVGDPVLTQQSPVGDVTGHRQADDVIGPKLMDPGGTCLLGPGRHSSTCSSTSTTGGSVYQRAPRSERPDSRLKHDDQAKSSVNEYPGLIGFPGLSAVLLDLKGRRSLTSAEVV